MILFAVVLTSWLLLTFPAAVLMGRCIARGLETGPLTGATASVPEQRGAQQDASGRASTCAERSPA